MTTLESAAFSSEDRRVQLIGAAGLAFLLLMYGSFKFFAFEAAAIQPLVENSPFLAWLYPLFGLRVTSALIGVFEVAAGLLIAARPWFPRASGYASLATSGML